MRDKNTRLSLLLKAVVVLCSFWGVGRSMFASNSVFMGGSTMLLYFTIQSNLWIGAACAAGVALLLRGCPLRPWMYRVKLTLTVAITLTGVVFCFVLVPTIPQMAWTLTNVLTHVIVPLAAVADFLVFDRRFAFRRQDCLWTAIPPWCYLLFSAVGYCARWNYGGGNNYPYFFLNWGSPAGAFGFSDRLPFMGVFYWVLVMHVIVLGAGLLYIALARRLSRGAAATAESSR